MSDKTGNNIISTLNKRIAAFGQGYRQNMALLGDDPQEINHLIKSCCHNSKLEAGLTLYVATSYCTKHDFLKTIALSLLSGYSKKIDSLDNLIHCLAPALPKTCDAIKRALKKEGLDFLSVVETVNAFIAETNMGCLLIIDRFLELACLFADFYSSFSKFIILQRHCMTIITESSTKEARKALADELNLLFGNFEIITVEDSAPLNNLVYLKEVVEGMNPSPFFISFIMRHTGSNSLYYEILAPLIKNNYTCANEINALSAIYENAIYRPDTYFFQKFMRRIECIQSQFKDYRNVIKLLIYMSEGYLRKKELLSLGIFDSKNLTLRLQRLFDLNYVNNLGNIYKIKDALFSFWLTHVFKVCANLGDNSLKKRLFMKSLTEYILLAHDEFKEDALTKILQLFASFKNDTISLQKKKYRLPSVDKTKTISFAKDNLHLLIGEGREIIFAGVKERGADETDITAFLEKGANIKGKGVKKVFITLDVASPTAQLIAKNSKITIWDINDINQLLSIYNKPNVAWESPAPREKDTATYTNASLSE